MSTPPFVALPHGVQRTDFNGTFGPLAALVAEPDTAARGTALLLPGFTGSKEDFLAAFPILRSLGWRVISIDLRGQYESPGPDSPDGYTLEEFAADTLTVAKTLRARHGQRVHLLGHSFGGLVARAAAITHLTDILATADQHAMPDQQLFASLTLLASGPAAIPGDLFAVAKGLAEALPTTPLQAIWDLKEQADKSNGWTPPSDEIHQFLRHRFLTNNPYALAGKARILTEISDAVDVLADLAATAGLPTLVAFGADDDRWPPAQQDLMASRLGARRFRWPDTAHSPAAEHADWCATTLEAFWSDVDGTDAQSINACPDKDSWPTGLLSEPIGYTAGMELRARVASTPNAVGKARRTIVRQLDAWGLANEIDDLQLIVSELVTNALRHAGGPVELRLAVTSSALRVEVEDSNPASLPSRRSSADDEPGGRGMPLIEALTSDWGVDVHTDSKVVWAELARAA